jgi:nitrogen fixation protein FixH
MKEIASNEFTGRHMLLIMLSFFGVIIAVNVTMAVFAGTSWTGFVVKNSYIASQEFNRKAAEARAQEALGWTSKLGIDGGSIRYSLVDRSGKPIATDGATAIFRRPAYEAEDETIRLSKMPDASLNAAQTLRDGIWIVEILTQAGLEHPYREARRIVIRGGAMQ